MAHELLVTTMPGRSGLYLAVQDAPNVIRPIARFMKGEESAKEFVAWCVKAGIRYEDTRGSTFRESGGPATGVAPATGSSG